MRDLTKDDAIILLSTLQVMPQIPISMFPEKYQELVRARSAKTKLYLIDLILNRFPTLEAEFKTIIDTIRNKK